MLSCRLVKNIDYFLSVVFEGFWLHFYRGRGPDVAPSRQQYRVLIVPSNNGGTPLLE